MDSKPKISGFTGYGGKYYRTITLNPHEQDPRKQFTFGEDKARLIVAHYEAIKAFAGGSAIAPLPVSQPTVKPPVVPPVVAKPQPKPQANKPKVDWAAMLNSN